MAKIFWLKLEKPDEAALIAAHDAQVQWVWLPEADISPLPFQQSDMGKAFQPEPLMVTLRSAQDVEAAATAARSGQWVVLDCPDWRIIPWENLVGLDRVLARVTDEHQARQAFEVLERGLEGVLLESADPNVIRAVGKLVHPEPHALSLVEGTVTQVEPVGQGDRACVDAAVLFQPNEGLLLGDQARALFLVAAETQQNPFVETRPFRVNAGGVHLYVLLSSNRTGYLTELGSGKTVYGVDSQGLCRKLVVGRIKIERRPLVKVVAECQTREASILLQHAETVCLLGPHGKRLSVATLEPGMRVLMYQAPEARHLGQVVNEWIVEG